MTGLRNIEIEDAIRAAPGDLDGYEVYADWLLEQGEPHGEVIAFAVQRARGAGTSDLGALAVEARLLRDRERVFGTLGTFNRGQISFDLELGFMSALRIYATGDDAARAVRAALNERAGAFLRELSVLEGGMQRGPTVAEHRATAKAIWPVLLELGVPKHIEAVALPLASDEPDRCLEALAGARRCTFAVRNVSVVAEHLHRLRALDTLTLTASDTPHHATAQLILDAAPVLASVPNLVLRGAWWTAQRDAIRGVLPDVAFVA